MQNGNGNAMWEVLGARWADVGGKVVALAEEFPEREYEFRPVDGVRSFAEQLRHVAFWNAYVAKTLRGEEADGSANELDAASVPNKDAVVRALRQSFDEVGAALHNGGSAPQPSELDSLVSFIEHGGEHYGQLVLYYRLKGLVPPASRS